jgi:flagellar FliJ protein
MPAFQFRLTTVLRLREAVRDERRGELADALRVEAALRERLGEFAAELESLRRQCQRVNGPGRVPIDGLLDAQRFELHVRGEQAAVQSQLQALAGEIERRRLALVEADREVRVLEKLRETRQAEHADDERRQEAKELDEVATRCVVREDRP